MCQHFQCKKILLHWKCLFSNTNPHPLRSWSHLVTREWRCRFHHHRNSCWTNQSINSTTAMPVPTANKIRYITTVVADMDPKDFEWSLMWTPINNPNRLDIKTTETRKVFSRESEERESPIPTQLKKTWTYVTVFCVHMISTTRGSNARSHTTPTFSPWK